MTMVARLKVMMKAVPTAPITASGRGILSRCNILTSGASTKLSKTAKAIGTRISRAK
jgi:hypothetical protein